MASREQIDQLYRDILGRDPEGDSAYNAWSGVSYEQARLSIATSTEAQGSGFDASVYGAQVVDPSTLNENEMLFYNTYMQHRPDQNVYAHELDNWVRHGSPSQLEADLRGAIRYVPQEDGRLVTIYSDKAVEIMGDEIHNLSGASAGNLILIPEKYGVNLGGDQWKSNGSEQGYSQFISQGNPTTGLLGDLGIDKYFPEELYAVADFYTLGIGSSILGGQKGKEESRKAIGKDLEPAVAIGNKVGQSVAAVAAGVATGNPMTTAAVASGFAAAEAKAAHSLGGNFDMKGLITDIGINFASAYVGGNIKGQMALSGATTSLRGGDTEDVLISMGTAAAANAVGDIGGKGGQVLKSGVKVAGKYAQNNDLTGALISEASGLFTSATRMAAQGSRSPGSLTSTAKPVSSFGEWVGRVKSNFAPGNFDNMVSQSALKGTNTALNKIPGLEDLQFPTINAPEMQPANYVEQNPPMERKYKPSPKYTAGEAVAKNTPQFMSELGSAFLAAGFISLGEDKRKAEASKYREKQKKEEERANNKNATVIVRKTPAPSSSSSSGRSTASSTRRGGAGVSRGAYTTFG